MSEQNYTSILPAIFKKIKWAIGTKNLDYGGGKYDNATQWLAEEQGVVNCIYDPLNRTEMWNKKVLDQYNYDTATISNVLNVIDSREARIEAMRTCYERLKPGGKCYITVYEGDKSRAPKVNQMEDYLDEVKQVFPRVIRWNDMYICEK